MSMPDRFGSILAARTWVYMPPFPGYHSDVVPRLHRPAEKTGHLRGTSSFETDWRPGVNEAVCGYGLHPDVGVPGPRCACGFYGVCSPWSLSRYGSRRNIFGVVALTGRIVPHEQGWRGQRAEIKGFILPNKEPSRRARRAVAEQTFLVEQLAAQFGVPTLDAWPELTPPDESVKNLPPEPENPFSLTITTTNMVTNTKTSATTNLPVNTTVMYPQHWIVKP